MSQILGALVGGVMEGINTGINYGISGALAAQSRSENYAYNEAAAQAAYARQTTMQERYYTPKALLRQYEEAGLSPSLLFGGTPGQGGTSVPKGNGPGGPQATFAPMSLLNAAQAADLLASAEVKKEQAKELRGENEFGKAEIVKMYQDIATSASTEKMNNTAAALTVTENALKEVYLHIAEATSTEQIQIVQDQAKIAAENATKAMYEARKEGLDLELAEKTFKARQTQIEQESLKAVQEVLKLKTENKYFNDLMYNSVAKLMAEVSNIQWRQDFDLACKKIDVLLEKWQKTIQEANIELAKEGMDLEAWKTKVNTATNIFTSVIKGSFIFGGLKNQGANAKTQPETPKVDTPNPNNQYY